MKITLNGLIAAPFTPMKPDGSLNLSAIPAYASHLKQAGISGVFIGGTTGEGPSLSIDERKQLDEAWNESANGLTVITHVGHLCLNDACNLAANAQSAGSRAVSAIAPSFFRPATTEALVDWCAQVAAAAPDIAFYFYHFPAITGVAFDMVDFLPLAAERIPNFGGIKFTHENLMDYGVTLAMAEGRFDVLFGRDEILLAALVLGARGAVGSTYNYSAFIYHKIMRAFAAGDLAGARRYQLDAIRYIQILIRYGGLAAGKAIMGLVGVDCGPVRTPLCSLTLEAQKSLKEDLEKSGFFADLHQGVSI